MKKAKRFELQIPAQEILNQTKSLNGSNRGDQCSSWLTSVVSFDTDSSNGLSEDEFYLFVTSADSPLNQTQYSSANLTDFKSLPWVYRVMYKSLACYCVSLGKGPDCCKGEDVEVTLDILTAPTPASASTINVGDEETAKNSDVLTEYRDFMCQMFDFPESYNNTINPTETHAGTSTVEISDSNSSEATSVSNTATAATETTTLTTTLSTMTMTTTTMMTSPTVTPLGLIGSSESFAISTSPSSMAPLQVESSSQVNASQIDSTSSITDKNNENSNTTVISTVILVGVLIIVQLLVGAGIIIRQKKREERSRVLAFACKDVFMDTDLEAVRNSALNVTYEELTENGETKEEVIESEVKGLASIQEGISMSLVHGDDSAEKNDNDDRSHESPLLSISYCSDDFTEVTTSEDEGQNQLPIGTALAALGVASTVASSIFTSLSQKSLTHDGNEDDNSALEDSVCLSVINQNSLAGLNESAPIAHKSDSTENERLLTANAEQFDIALATLCQGNIIDEKNEFHFSEVLDQSESGSLDQATVITMSEEEEPKKIQTSSMLAAMGVASTIATKTFTDLMRNSSAQNDNTIYDDNNTDPDLEIHVGSRRQVEYGCSEAQKDSAVVNEVPETLEHVITSLSKNGQADFMNSSSHEKTIFQQHYSEESSDFSENVSQDEGTVRDDECSRLNPLSTLAAIGLASTASASILSQKSEMSSDGYHENIDVETMESYLRCDSRIVQDNNVKALPVEEIMKIESERPTPVINKSVQHYQSLKNIIKQASKDNESDNGSSDWSEFNANKGCGLTCSNMHGLRWRKS